MELRPVEVITRGKDGHGVWRGLFYVRKTEALEALSGWTWRHVTPLEPPEKDEAAGRGLWKFIRIYIL